MRWNHVTSPCCHLHNWGKKKDIEHNIVLDFLYGDFKTMQQNNNTKNLQGNWIWPSTVSVGSSVADRAIQLFILI